MVELEGLQISLRRGVELAGSVISHSKQIQRFRLHSGRRGESAWVAAVNGAIAATNSPAFISLAPSRKSLPPGGLRGQQAPAVAMTASAALRFRFFVVIIVEVVAFAADCVKTRSLFL